MVNIRRMIGYLMVLFLVICCKGEQRKQAGGTHGHVKVFRMVADTFVCRDSLNDSPTERQMRALGFVDIQEVDASIQVCLIYATADNFVGKVLYRDLRKAFMLPETAWRLVKAQQKLKKIRPDLSLLIYDAARPMEVQREMWAQVRGTDKRMYGSNPANGGGLHNYGAAIDLTLVDAEGNPLPMGSAFDYFGNEARPDCEISMVKQGRILPGHLKNRRLLRQVMTESGFRILSGEWWHFNLLSREEAKRTLKVIE